MDNFEKLESIGEGTYGTVIKCRHKLSGAIVAIKKFKESEEDPQIRKTVMREIKMLKQLKNDHIVNLIDVFRQSGKVYLIFEYVDHNILQDLEKCPRGMNDDKETGVVRKFMWQLLQGVEYLHKNNIIHRDIKPENILVSANGVIKLCDFGFARTLLSPNAQYTDYVATRWYRSPELLVGDTAYGKPVDIWALGCIFSELLTGQPLFPGDSDIDQLYRIVRCLGPLPRRHVDAFLKNPLFVGTRVPGQETGGKGSGLESRLPSSMKQQPIDFMKRCFEYEQSQRATVEELLHMPYFTNDSWCDNYQSSLESILKEEREATNLVIDKLKRRTKARDEDGNSSTRSPNPDEVKIRKKPNIQPKSEKVGGYMKAASKASETKRNSRDENTADVDMDMLKLSTTNEVTTRTSLKDLTSNNAQYKSKSKNSNTNSNNQQLPSIDSPNVTTFQSPSNSRSNNPFTLNTGNSFVSNHHGTHGNHGSINHGIMAHHTSNNYSTSVSKYGGSEMKSDGFSIQGTSLGNNYSSAFSPPFPPLANGSPTKQISGTNLFHSPHRKSRGELPSRGSLRAK